jgi:hypothetical protein
MSWDRKKRGTHEGYYYQSRRVDGRSVKTYFGRGPLAEMAARLDEHERELRRAQRDARSNERLRLALLDGRFKEARGLVNLLVAATLVLAGCYLHHGFWRRRGSHATKSKAG